MENTTGFFHSRRKWLAGMPADAPVNHGNSPAHRHSAFPTEMGEQMILMSFTDVIITQLMHLGIGYKRKACKSLGAVIWVFGTEQLGQLLGGHQPSTSAVSLPLMEQGIFQ